MSDETKLLPSACDGCAHRDPVDPSECNVFARKITEPIVTCTARSPAYLYGSPPGAEALERARATKATIDDAEKVQLAGLRAYMLPHPTLLERLGQPSPFIVDSAPPLLRYIGVRATVPPTMPSLLIETLASNNPSLDDLGPPAPRRRSAWRQLRGWLACRAWSAARWFDDLAERIEP